MNNLYLTKAQYLAIVKTAIRHSATLPGNVSQWDGLQARLTLPNGYAIVTPRGRVSVVTRALVTDYSHVRESN